ncbi:membrane hypothetical protein [Desulfovibrionales bacterium]
MLIVLISGTLILWVCLAGLVLASLRPNNPMDLTCQAPFPLFTIWMLGLFILELTIYTGISLRWLALGLPASLPVLTIWAGMAWWMRRHIRPTVEFSTLTLLIAINLPLTFLVLAMPICEWDARSIWFFHGKIFFYQGHFGFDANVRKALPFVPHFDYPKGLAAIVALVATMVGFWNEFLPKIGLLLFQVGLILGVAGLRQLSLTVRLGVMAILLASDTELLYNGYMDGWLAAYCLLGHCYIIAWYRSREPGDLVAGLLALALLPLLKNEGLALAGIGGIAFILSTLLLDQEALSEAIRTMLQHLALLLPGTLPTLIWTLCIRCWGLKNDLSIFSTGALERISSRLVSNAEWQIYENFFCEEGLTWLYIAALSFFILSLAYARISHIRLKAQRRHRFAFCFPITTAILYGFLLNCIYLLTPQTLEWHIATSGKRIGLPILLLCFQSFLALQELRPTKVKPIQLDLNGQVVLNDMDVVGDSCPGYP